MRRITDFAEVDYFVPDCTVLPEDIRATLALYIGKHCTLGGKSGTMYTIPRYLMTQWLTTYTPESNEVK